MPSALVKARCRVLGRSFSLRLLRSAQGWPSKPITLLMGFRGGRASTWSPACCSPRSRSRSASGWSSTTSRAPAATSPRRSSPARQARRLHLPAGHGGDARRQSGALPPARLRRRSRLHAGLDPGRRLQCADHQPGRDRRASVKGFHRQGEGRARQVQLRLDRQRHGHASRLRRVQCHGRAGHGARALQGRPRRHPGGAEGRRLRIFNQVQTILQQYARRQGAPAGRHHQEARGRHPRRADASRRRACRATRAIRGSRSSDPRASIRAIARKIQRRRSRWRSTIPRPTRSSPSSATRRATRPSTQFKATVKRDRAKWAEVVKAGRCEGGLT